MPTFKVTGGALTLASVGSNYPDNSLPGDQPGIDNSLPGSQPGIDNALPRPPPGVFPPPTISNPIVPIPPGTSIPPGTIWPPLPPSIPAGKAIVLVAITGVGWRWAVLDVPQPK